tara:strand:- start:982 stop:1347 length:366 start_codon:yes stop_codon:yes gene_type:complete
MRGIALETTPASKARATVAAQANAKKTCVMTLRLITTTGSSPGPGGGGAAAAASVVGLILFVVFGFAAVIYDETAWSYALRARALAFFAAPSRPTTERVCREVKSARTWPLRKHSLHKNRF